MTLVVRQAGLDDVRQAAALAEDFAQQSGDAPSADELAARIARIFADPAHLVVVADHDGILVGYAHAQDNGPTLRHSWSVARLHDLYVRPDHRQSGLGRRLHWATILWCRRRSVRYLRWQAPPHTIAFYQHLGYAPDFAGNYATRPLFVHSFVPAAPPQDDHG